jgi:hypothetical protein
VFLPSNNKWQPPLEENNEKKKKPTLILHVGPHKTGTTFLQIRLLKNSKLEKTRVKDKIVNLEGFGYKDLEAVIDKCLLEPHWTKGKRKDVPPQPRNCEGWTRLVTLWNDTHRPRTALIHSSETFAQLPDNNFTISKLRSIQKDWNVQVLVFYRRPYSWFPSMYKQSRKESIYRSRSNTWMDFKWTRNQRDFKVEAFPSFLDRFVMRDSLKTAEFFQLVFGKHAVQILDFPSANLAVELVCHGLNATNLCAKIQEQRLRPANELQLLLDEDAIVVEAFQLGLLRDNGVVNRHEATLLLHEHLSNGTDPIPKICLSDAQTEWLWNRSLVSEQRLARHPVSEDALRRDFDGALAAGKFCCVNAKALMQMKTWRRLLQSCIFQGTCTT